ncbi:MAG: hypothetical protein LIP03_02125 [Bacteroidales bacterium]|nr:hypothetical protein [Bacteroidales bacterium]
MKMDISNRLLVTLLLILTLTLSACQDGDSDSEDLKLPEEEKTDEQESNDSEEEISPLRLVSIDESISSSPFQMKYDNSGRVISLGQYLTYLFDYDKGTVTIDESSNEYYTFTLNKLGYISKYSFYYAGKCVEEGTIKYDLGGYMISQYTEKYDYEGDVKYISAIATMSLEWESGACLKSSRTEEYYSADSSEPTGYNVNILEASGKVINPQLCFSKSFERWIYYGDIEAKYCFAGLLGKAPIVLPESVKYSGYSHKSSNITTIDHEYSYKFNAQGYLIEETEIDYITDTFTYHYETY